MIEKLENFYSQMIRYIRPSRRLLSTQVPSATYTSTFVSDTIPTSPNKTSKNTEKTIGEIVAHINSDQFIHSLSSSHFTSLAEYNSQVKYQLYTLLKDRQYDQLYKAMAAISSNWQNNHLDSSEITYFLGGLIDHQLELLLELTKLKHARSTKINEVLILEKTKEVRQRRTQIRQMYSKLLFGNNFFIYSPALRANIHDPNIQTQATGYVLSVGDYENLIKFEYRNNKLDLANKWFERFDTQYDKSHYTSSMWDYKFKVSGGDPNFWDEFSNDVYYLKHKVVKSNYIKQDFNSLLTEYLKYFHIDEHLPTIIYFLGYMKLLPSIFKIVEGKYGINQSGELVDRKSIPDINVLNALVVSLSYNNRYYETMKLINTFQKEFDLDLSTPETKHFWDNFIKWTDLSSRFNVHKVLMYYLKNYNPQATASKFEDLLKDPQFDYEQYLSFYEDIKQKRIRVMKQVWQLYRSSHQTFSVKNFKVYSQFLKQAGQEDNIFAFLKDLNKIYHQHNVSPRSFNFKYLGLNTLINSIENLYIYNMTTMIDIKMEQGHLSQVSVLINEWGLNEFMKTHLTNYYNKQLPKVQEQLREKQTEELEQQREEDEERLLKLF